MLKNGLSKSLMFILVFVLTLSTGLLTGVFAKSADNNKVNYCDDLEKLGDVSYQNFDGVTKKVINIKDTKKFGEINGMNVKPTGEITLVVPMVKSTPKLIDRTGPDVSILAAQYVKVKRESEACGTKKIRSSSYAPPGGKMIISESVNASYNANVSVSAAAVSAGVGFSVTKGYNVSDEQPITVPPGKSGIITAYPWYQTYEFDVMERRPWPLEDEVVGSGTAYLPIGVCFVPKIN
ncbi:hypothetical protein [Brevibacillus brevis]|uniref:Uncharacterized protein n=1 Tax=Brevibacillus brevis TaxID=1393 RepID=A0A517I692_BREBE|nr:hypothetical protein [Brevibacillus brevis]QDS34410.1 hypothetical protein FPS98_10700 [Brevibacillus brevis]